MGLLTLTKIYLITLERVILNIQQLFMLLLQPIQFHCIFNTCLNSASLPTRFSTCHEIGLKDQ